MNQSTNKVNLIEGINAANINNSSAFITEPSMLINQQS